MIGYTNDEEILAFGSSGTFDCRTRYNGAFVYGIWRSNLYRNQNSGRLKVDVGRR